MGTYCYVARAGAVGSAARGASAPIDGGEGQGHFVAAARLQLVRKKDEVVRTAAALSARLRSCHLLTMKYNLEDSQKLCFCLKF